MKHIAYFLLVMMIGFNLQAGEIPPTTNVTPPEAAEAFPAEVTSPRSVVVNHESRTAAQLYITEQPSLMEVVTKPMAIPPGWEMKRISHPPKYVCSEYAQPDTFEMVQTYVPKAKPVVVGESNVDSITIITEGE